MNEPIQRDDERDGDFLETDQPLRADVRRLGALVGAILREQEGAEFLANVEQVRKAAIARREGTSTTEDVEKLLAGLPQAHAANLVRAFALYFQVVNLAERTHRIRRRRDYERTSDAKQPGSLRDILGELARAGVAREALVCVLAKLRIEPVFTAHPTEAVRRVHLKKEQIIADRLIGDLDGNRTRVEREQDMEIIRDVLTSGWQTSDLARTKPTVADELEHVSFYLGEVLYHSLATFHEALDRALDESYSPGIHVPDVLRFGSWVGGDMDGNPNVGAQTIEESLRAHRRIVLGAYQADLGRIAEILTQSQSRVGVDAEVLSRIADHRAVLPGADAVPQDPAELDAPYHALLTLMTARLEATQRDSTGAYPDPDAFVADLELLAASLSKHRGRNAGWFSLARMVRRASAFGFHLAALDLRQESTVHSAALTAIVGADQNDDALARLAEDAKAQASAATDETAERVLAVFRSAAKAIDRYGSRAFGPYIISMTHGARDVLSVLALARHGGLGKDGTPVPLDIAPLFETIDDLRAAPDVLRDLFQNAAYQRHLEARGKVQWVMLGYSDSAKDGGLVASRWSLQRAQVALTALAAESGIAIHFFHGRGGSLSRGGSKTERAVNAAPRGSVNGVLRVTEQGEVIHRKYGLRALALRDLEQSTAAVLRATLRPRPAEPREAEWRTFADELSQVSKDHYRAMVYDEPSFTPYFREATPIDLIERLRLGSRPAKRKSGAGPEHLRAIPWVFAWSQDRSSFTAWYGAGTALAAAEKTHGLAALRDMAKDWPFFALLLGDLEMILAKSDMGIFARYSELAGELHGAMFPRIDEEFDRTRAMVLAVRDQRELLATDRVLRRSIRLRNPYIDPMSILQVDLLARWRAQDRPEDSLFDALVSTVNGISAGIQNTG